MTHHLRGPRYSFSCQYPILKPNCNMYTHSYLKYKQKLMYFVQIRIKYIWLFIFKTNGSTYLQPFWSLSRILNCNLQSYTLHIVWVLYEQVSFLFCSLLEAFSCC
jgi:hypothetical protein